MGLKGFHILFIVCSTALALGFCFWALRDWSHTGNGVHLALGLASLVGVAMLVKYTNWFMKKLRKLEA